MVSFTAADPGTAAAVWSADGRLRSRPKLRLDHVDALIVVAAHPDDETLGAGGLIAQCAERGVPVRIVCVTDGAASHPGQPGLAGTRGAELADAARVLAPQVRPELLGFRDGATLEDRDEITTALGATLGPLSPNTIVAAPWRGDGHRDHRIVGEIVAALAGDAELLEYPIWMWHWASPVHPDVPWERLVRLEVDSDSKQRAIACFPSQTGGPDPLLHPRFLEHFARGEEYFVSASRSDTAPAGDATADAEADHPAARFEALHARSADPWHVRTRWYEERKRHATLAALPRPRYRSTLEIGCSIGALSEPLAGRSDQMLAIDLSERAVASARRAVGSAAEVRVQDAVSDFPEGTYDLVVLSEVAYYWDEHEIREMCARISAVLNDDGVVVACHWRHTASDFRTPGDRVHEILREQGWFQLVEHREADFLLEVFRPAADSTGDLEVPQGRESA